MHSDRALVRLGGRSGCAACDAGRGCGAGVFGRMLNRRPAEIELPAPEGAAVGQAVLLGIPEQLFLRLALKIYLWPLLAGMAGAVLGHLLASSLDAQQPWLDIAALVSAISLAVWALRRQKASAVEFPGADAVNIDRILHSEHEKS